MKTVIGGARYPYGVNSYQGLSNHINNLEASKPRSPDTVATQLRHSQAYEKKVETQKERLYKRKERSLLLTNHWMEADKHPNQKNDYEQNLDQLKNTKLKGLTHEELESIEKWQILFGKGVR